MLVHCTVLKTPLLVHNTVLNAYEKPSGNNEKLMQITPRPEIIENLSPFFPSIQWHPSMSRWGDSKRSEDFVR